MTDSTEAAGCYDRGDGKCADHPHSHTEKDHQPMTDTPSPEATAGRVCLHIRTSIPMTGTCSTCDAEVARDAELSEAQEQLKAAVEDRDDYLRERDELRERVRVLTALYEGTLRDKKDCHDGLCNCDEIAAALHAGEVEQQNGP